MRHIQYTFAGILLGLLSSGLVQAQSGSQSSNLEEIVVTATMRGGELNQDIPVTVQAISGDQLTEAGALDFNDYYRLIPSLSVNDQGPGHKTYIIRGISSQGAGTVGLYFDETIVTGEFLPSEGGRAPDIKLYDMNRIEVLKGPQGPTFGSSSLSGTIRWIPNYPDLAEFGAAVGTTLSATKDADWPSWAVDAMVNARMDRQPGTQFLPGFFAARASQQVERARRGRRCGRFVAVPVARDCRAHTPRLCQTGGCARRHRIESARGKTLRRDVATGFPRRRCRGPGPRHILQA